MACWVAPTVAAEYWNITVDDVMERVESGTVSSRVLEGFLLVDVEPKDLPQELSGPVVSPREVEGLTAGLDEELAAANRSGGRVNTLLADLEQSKLRESGDWRTARKLAGAKRRRPALAAI